ncbi:hypothetical protein A946_11670, partial [Methylacidiphilum kamchatkense Kam1]
GCGEDKEEFLDPALRHACYSEERLRDQLSGFNFLYTVWEAFEDLAYGGQEEEAKAKIEKLSRGSFSLNELFGFVDQYEKLVEHLYNVLYSVPSEKHSQSTMDDELPKCVFKQLTKFYPKLSLLILKNKVSKLKSRNTKRD